MGHVLSQTLEGMTGPSWYPPQSHLLNEGTTGALGFGLLPSEWSHHLRSSSESEEPTQACSGAKKRSQLAREWMERGNAHATTKCLGSQRVVGEPTNRLYWCQMLIDLKTILSTLVGAR